MTKGYWIGRIDVSNPEAYGRYIKANAEPFARHGAKFLVRGGALEVAEGKARARNVVIEFPSYKAAVDCYHDPKYQEAKALRAGASESDLIIIEGYDGPQPGA